LIYFIAFGLTFGVYFVKLQKKGCSRQSLKGSAPRPAASLSPQPYAISSYNLSKTLGTPEWHRRDKEQKRKNEDEDGKIVSLR